MTAAFLPRQPAEARMKIIARHSAQVSSDSVIEIIMRSDSDARVHFDSHSHYVLSEDDRILVKRYPYTVSLLHPVGHSYYRMLREKLNWNRE